MKAKLAENLLPPIIYRPLLRVYLLARGHGWHIFRGRYPTLADVPTDPEGQNSEWFVVNAAKQVANLKFGLSRRPTGDEAGLLLLPVIASESLNGGRGLTVLDYGGGAATGLARILERVPAFDLTGFRYVLIETPAMCHAVRDPLAAVQRERFRGATFEVADEIPAALPHPLIVHARGSIQYVPEYRAELSKLLALAPETFIVAHTPLTEAPTFAQQQLNRAHHKLGRWVFNRGELIGEIEKAGYRLALAFDHVWPPIAFKDAPGPCNDASMVFHKLTPSIHANPSSNR